MDPNDRFGERANGWRKIQILAPQRRLTNVDNYVYFCLLAMMRDHGWRLARDEKRARAGRFERI